MKIEVCANGFESALLGEQGGADRIELCDNLYEGGTTPSAAHIELCAEGLSIPTFVMIRPRGGDFIYSDLEIKIMKKDIDFCKKVGVTGVVLGCLQPDGRIDITRTQALIAHAKPMKVTFHRAFDLAKNPCQALEDVITTGADHLLTSGRKDKAVQGLELIKKLNLQAGNRIEIIAGSGIRPSNIQDFIKAGIPAVHLSGIIEKDSSMWYKNPAVRLSNMPIDKIYRTDTKVIRQIKEAVNGIAQGVTIKKAILPK